MFCTQCGTENGDDAAFCANCGNPLKSASADQTAASEPAPVPGSASQHKGKTSRIIGIVVAALVVVGLIIGVIVWFNFDQANKARHEAHDVTIVINAPGYSDQDTLIPIRATGTNLDGAAVDEVFFVNASGEGVSLPKGTYDLSVAASPLTADGVLYKDFASKFNIVLPDDLENGAVVDATAQVRIDLEKSTALDETQEMIDAAYNTAIQDSSQVDKANLLVEKAKQAHDEAVAAKQREDELARARQNPASVNATSGSVTLKGKLARQERTTDDTGMGWASVDYILEFDAPVSITYRTSSGGTTTSSFSQIQVESKEIYIATDPDANAKLGQTVIANLQPYVGQYVAVTGDISSSGTMHTYGAARFGTYSIAPL